MLAMLTIIGATVTAAPFLPAAEVQEHIYTPAPANNGAGPLWCYGGTCLVRHGDDVYVSGLETLPDRKPLNNCRWVLYHRGAQGWETLQADPSGRQREPCPIFLAADGRLYLSSNPTLTPLDTYNGPAQPTIMQFDLARPKQAPVALVPEFVDHPPFGEHSYRGFGGDGPTGELLLMNIWMYDRFFWSFRDRQGKWSKGKLDFPIGKEYDPVVPIRICYPEILVRDKAVYFLGVSDIVEPIKAWREYKEKQTGQHWDYDFRRLFFTWTPDITKEPFRPWSEVATCEPTCGHISNLDLWVDAGGRAHMLWIETSTWHPFMRDKYFPDHKITQSLHYGIFDQGKLTHNLVLLRSGEGIKGEIPSYGRFHVTPEGRLFAFYYTYGTNAEGKGVNENRLVELLPDGTAGATVPVPFELPFSSFMTATGRGGTRPSKYLDVYGNVSGGEGLWYGRVDLTNKLLADWQSTISRTATGSQVTLDGSASRALDGAVAGWTWSVDGQTRTGVKALVTVNHGGPLPVTLTVRDAAGHERSLRRTLQLPLAPQDAGLNRWNLVLRTEAESYTAEGGGEIHVRNDKLAASGLSVSHWNSKGHWLEWTVEIPQTDEYRLLLRYATPEKATRALLVDGQRATTVSLAPTGGYGTEALNHWAGTVARTGDRPWTVKLTAGRHTVRLLNEDGTGCNLDYVEWLAGTAPFAASATTRDCAEGDYRYLLPLTGTLLPSRMTAELGSCYTIPLGSNYRGDGVKDSPESKLRLFENGKELGPAHTIHVDIRTKGSGRFSHWIEGLYFSASDNSDPRRNGRTYTWRIDK